jgi:hypothetical protein
MKGPRRELGRIERWMQSVITHPGGVAAGIDSPRARAEIDLSAGEVELVVNRSKSQTSLERLQIYAGAYYARLLECLREEFPAVAHAAGPEAFGEFVLRYLQAYPSRSYTLAKLGDKFPDFLAETRPADAASGDAPSWPDFLIDLARLERAYSEVFDGPGIERRTLLGADELLAIPQSRWGEVTLVAAECLRLASFRFPVHEYASAVRQKQPAAQPLPAPTFLAITRRDYVVRRIPLSDVQYELLGRIVAGEPLGEAIARAADQFDGDVDGFAAALERWFQEWTAAQFFREVRCGS